MSDYDDLYKLFCWLGWHDGNWGKREKSDFTHYNSATKKERGAGSKYHQQFECTACGLIKRRLISDETL